MNLSTLLAKMSDSSNDDAFELYEKHFFNSIQEEGFTPEQVIIIADDSYERGRLNGAVSIVGHAIRLCKFAHSFLKVAQK